MSGARASGINNLYLQTARYYDMDSHTYSERDLSFYLDLARNNGGRILELACGTGRVTVPLLEAGYEVWALDLSAPMLAELERKADGLTSQMRERLHIVHADMSEFDLHLPFDLVIIPFRGFQALLEPEQITSCLTTVRRHLASTGRFVLNTFAMRPGERLLEYSVERTDWKQIDPRTGDYIRRARRLPGVDYDRQIMYPEVIYYVTGSDGTTQRLSDQLALRYYFEYQLQVYLLATGYRISASYGDYDRRRIGTGSEFIFVCRHAVGVPALG